MSNHCGVASAILNEANERYGTPDDLEEAIELLEDAQQRLDMIYTLAKAIESMGQSMDDGLRNKHYRIEELETLLKNSKVY